MSLTTLTTKTRFLVGDISTVGTDVFTYNASSIFTLTEDNVSTVTDVSINGVSSGIEYTYGSTLNQVTITTSMSSGDTVIVYYTYYPNYSDAIVENYIKASLVYISANNYADFIEEDGSIYPDPTEREDNLICMIASTLINPDNKSYRLPDITINVSKESLPTGQMISRIISIFKHNSHGIFDIG